jgi:multiple sugar transport system ATP-binding protein
MSVADNMAFSLRMKGWRREAIAERVRVAADILGLEELLDRYPRQLSGGQRQRVAMGRAIVRDPSVFLFDEPLSNLDAKLRVQMRTEIKALHQRLRTTTVYVTHDQIEAMTMADVIVVMQDGRVKQMGAPLELYDRPANRFVAGFIGSPAMNFFEGRIEGDRFVTVAGARLPLPAGAARANGAAVVYGARPEHLALVEPGAECGTDAVVRVVEPTGAELQVVAEADGAEVVAVFRERHAIKPGDRVRLTPDPSRAHIFRASDGERVS